MAGKGMNGGKDMAGNKRYNLKLFWREKMICGGKGKDMAGKDIEGTESVIDGQTCGTGGRFLGPYGATIEEYDSRMV